MKTKKYWVLAVALFFGLTLSCYKCFAIEQRRFHSETNGYSVAIPQGWKQVPENIVRQAFEAGMSENKLTLNIETVLAIEFDETGLKHPYAVIYVNRYSKYGVNRPAKKEEIKELFKETVKQLQLTTTLSENLHNYLPESIQGIVSQMEFDKLYLDNENMLFLVGMDMEVASLGKMKNLSFGAFGRYALVKMFFSCQDSDWRRFRNDGALILNSFQFDPTTDYKGAQQKNKFFGEDLLIDVAVYGTIALTIFLIGLVGRLCKSKVKNRAEDEQKQ